MPDRLHTFAVDETADDDNCYLVILALWGVRGEIGGVNGIGNDWHNLWVESCSENRVLLAGVRHAHDVVGVTQRHGEKLVGQHRADVSEAEERVVSEHLEMKGFLRFTEERGMNTS